MEHYITLGELVQIGILICAYKSLVISCIVLAIKLFKGKKK